MNLKCLNNRNTISEHKKLDSISLTGITKNQSNRKLRTAIKTNQIITYKL